MATDGPDELTLEEIFRHMEEVARSEYPNPQRVGCPSEHTLEAFARDPRSFRILDSIFDHVGKCSPCALFIHQIRSGHPD
jgi:hypothetical protein